MGEVIKTVFVNYIVCALAGGFLEYVAPKNARKTLRVVLVSVMIIVSFSPILKEEIDFSAIYNDLNFEENSNSTTYDGLMHTANITEKKIYNEMRNLLINLGIDEYEIYVKTDVETEDNTVYLEEIKIQIPQEFESKIPIVEKSVNEEYKSVLVVEKLVEK